MLNDRSRRSFIKEGCVAGTVGLTAFAGCLGDDGEVPDGEPVEEVTLLTLAESVDPFRFEYGQWIADEVEEVTGIPVDLYGAESAEYGDMATQEQNEDWDLIVRRSGNEFDPLNTMINQFFHSQYGEGGLNWWNYSNSEIDELLDEQSAAEEDRRIEISHEVNEMLVDDMAAAPILVQERAMPIWGSRYDNWVDQVEHGLGSFFNYLRMEPTDDEYSTLAATNIEEVHSLNPFDDFGRFPRTLTTLIYDKLIQIDPEQDNEWVPWAAEEVEIVELDEIEVTLQEGIEFHDGEELTTSDVEFTIERAVDEAPQVGNRWEDLDEIEVHDDYAMTFHLEQGSAETMMWDAFDNTFIVPEHEWEDVDNVVDHEPEPPIGSGPFEVIDWARGEQIELDTNDDYHREDGPNIDGIVHTDSADLQSAVNMIETGEVSQMENELDIDDVETFEADDDIDVSRVFMISNHWLGFDHSEGHSPFAGDEDERLALRWAVAHSIPKQDIIDGVYGGLAEANHQHLSLEFEEWQSPNVEEFWFNPEEAESYLEEAGFEWDGDGQLYWPEGFEP